MSKVSFKEFMQRSLEKNKQELQQFSMFKKTHETQLKDLDKSINNLEEKIKHEYK